MNRIQDARDKALALVGSPRGKFGYLKVLEVIFGGKHGIRARVACHCGRRKVVYLKHLRANQNGKTRSCGCMFVPLMLEKRKKTMAAKKASG